MSDTSAADIAAVMGRDNDGVNGVGGIWAIVLVVIIAAMFGGWNGNNSAVTQADLCMTSNFTQLENSVGRISDQQAAIARQNDNAFSTLGYAVQAGFNDVNTKIADLQTATTAQIQSVKDLIQNNKIEAMQAKINQLELQQATSNVVRYPSGFSYNAGNNPFCSCGDCTTAF